MVYNRLFFCLADLENNKLVRSLLKVEPCGESWVSKNAIMQIQAVALK